MPGLFKAKIGGPVRVVKLVIYKDWVTAQIQDPKHHENLDSYTLREGAVGDGKPESLPWKMKTAKTWTRLWRILPPWTSRSFRG